MLCSSALALIICTAEASAQTNPTPSTTAATDQDQAGIADIVVTAQRREQSAQTAAVAIDAVTGDALVAQGITDSYQITKSVPALTVTNGGGASTSLYLRGVGNKTSSSWTDPAVAISYDGVFLGRSTGAFGTSFYDLERIEVLKGPQGILYGRNATGGAINVIPAKPRLNDRSAGFDVAVGSYDTVQAQAYANLSLGSTAALRLAATRQVHDGYNRDGTSDQRTSGLRGQLLFEPTDALSVRLAGDYTHVGGIGAGSTYLGNYNPNASGGYDFVAAPASFGTSEGLGTPAANAYRQTLLGAPGFGFLTALNARPYQDFDYWGVNAEVNYKTGIGTITLIPAYRKTKGSSIFQVPAFNSALTNEKTEQYSGEARLAGRASVVDYILGGYYFNETIDSLNEYNQEFVLPLQTYRQKTESWALFGQLTANLTDWVRLVGGARYTHDHKDMNGLISNFITFCGGLPPANIVPPASFANGCAAPDALPRYPNFLNGTDTLNFLTSQGWIAPAALTNEYQVFPLLNGRGTILKTYNPVIDDGSYSRVTWKGSVEVDLAPRSLLYATIETGYRAGGFQLAEGRPRYDPEFLTAYTVGVKNRFFGNRVQLNLEAFLWKYRDQQITYFTVDTSGTLISSTENAGRATSKGIDVDAIVTPTRTTTLTGKVQYLDAKYDELQLLTASPRDNFGCPFTLTGATAGGAPVKSFDCSGNQALFAPKWTVNLGAEQRVPLGGELELVGAVNTAWRDDQIGGFEYLAFERIPAYWTTDANLALKGRDGGTGWSLSAFVLNLENKRRVAAPQLAPTGQAISIFTAPRTYGLRLSADF